MLIFWIVNTAILQGVILYLCLKNKRLKAKNKKMSDALEAEKKRGEFNRAVSNKLVGNLLAETAFRQKLS